MFCHKRNKGGSTRLQSEHISALLALEGQRKKTWICSQLNLHDFISILNWERHFCSNLMPAVRLWRLHFNEAASAAMASPRRLLDANWSLLAIAVAVLWFIVNETFELFSVQISKEIKMGGNEKLKISGLRPHIFTSQQTHNDLN